MTRALAHLKAELIAWRHFLKFRTAAGAPLWVDQTVNLERRPGATMRFEGRGPDPQLWLSGLPVTHGRAGLGLFEVRLQVERGKLVSPRLYLDRGAGFNEVDRVDLVDAEDDSLVALIPELRGVRRLRFDPSEEPVDLTLVSMQLRRPRPEPGGPFTLERWAMRRQGVASLDLSGVRLAGVDGIGGRGVEPEDVSGVFRFTDGDPQIILAIDGKGGRDPVALSFEIEALGGVLGGPRLYIDYGKGFDQDASFALAPQPDGAYRALIARPDLRPRLRWDPSDRPGVVRLAAISVVPAPDLASTSGEPGEGPVAETLRLNKENFNASVALAYDYGRWIEAVERPDAADPVAMTARIDAFAHRPRFSFVTPTYNTPPDLLEACIRSMLEQVYPNFEICIADDCSSDPRVRATLERLASEDARVKVAFRTVNGHISAASNSALELVTGDYVVLVDHDDIVPNYALFAVAEAVNRHPGAKVLYSDEDKIGPDGARMDPYFKSKFNTFLMYGHNMVSHLGVYRTDLVRQIGGFRLGYEGSQDYDLFLRAFELCEEDEIVHVPAVLYHWRMIPGSTAVSADQKSYAIVAAQKSLNDHFERRGLPLRSVDGVAPGLTGLTVIEPAERATVSIIIPTRDRLDLLQPCIDSLRAALDDKTQVVIVDNGSEEPDVLAYLQALSREPWVRLVPAPGPFNFSRICNLGAQAASGGILCFLNNDTELLEPAWLSRARGLLSMPKVGVVGARLLYPDKSIQHFGLYLGMGAHGVAGTPHRGLPETDFGPFGKARLVQEFSAVTAACLFVRREVFEAVEGFDEGLEVAYNDVDFCLKVRGLGFKVVCDPDIVLIHKESKSRGLDSTSQARSRRLDVEAGMMRERWRNQLAHDPYYSPNLTLDRDDFSLADRPRQPAPWWSSADPDTQNSAA